MKVPIHCICMQKTDWYIVQNFSVLHSTKVKKSPTCLKLLRKWVSYSEWTFLLRNKEHLKVNAHWDSVRKMQHDTEVLSNIPLFDSWFGSPLFSLHESSNNLSTFQIFGICVSQNEHLVINSVIELMMWIKSSWSHQDCEDLFSLNSFIRMMRTFLAKRRRKSTSCEILMRILYLDENKTVLCPPKCIKSQHFAKIFPQRHLYTFIYTFWHLAHISLILQHSLLEWYVYLQRYSSIYSGYIWLESKITNILGQIASSTQLSCMFSSWSSSGVQ